MFISKSNWPPSNTNNVNCKIKINDTIKVYKVDKLEKKNISHHSLRVCIIKLDFNDIIKIYKVHNQISFYYDTISYNVESNLL